MGYQVKVEPYYDHGGIQIFHGDCLEILSGIKADVMVTDPPYGMAYESGWKAGRPIEGDETIAARDAVLSLWSGPAIVFGRWSEPRPRGTRIVLYWDKGDWPGMGDLKLPWGPSTEEIYILGEGFSGKREGQLIRCPRRQNGEHPTAKPEELMQRLIEKTSGVVIDPFAGGGTTLRAAKDLGRKAIGIEIEERYCEIAAKRLGQEVLPFED